MKQLLLLPVLLLIYVCLVLGCLRSGALLVDMHDDVCFLAGIGAYLCVFPVSLLFGWLAIKIIKP